MSDFDFSKYNPKDPWHFPPERLIHFAKETRNLFKSSRTKWAKRNKYPDMRYVVFHEMHSQSYTFMVLSLMIRDKGMDLEWWNSLPELHGKFDKTMVKSQNINFRFFLQSGFFGNIHRQLEICLRQIQTSLDPEGGQEASSFSRVWKNLFYQSGLQKYEPLIQLMTVVRNCISHNGKYCPVNHKNLRLIYKKKEFLFYNEKEMDPEEFGFLDFWEFLLFLFREMIQMLNELFESPYVMAIRFVPTRYLG